MKISRFIELYKNFGGDVAFAALGASRFWKMNYVKHRKVLNYLQKNYSDFIQNYKPRPCDFSNKNQNTIWTLWWQGGNIPDVVKISHSSINKFRGSHDFKILTRNDFRDYVNLPDYILEKFNAGKITITHLSDIIRFYLLFNYGGLWLDSTVVVSREIPEDIFTADYYTVRRDLTPRNRNVAQDRWTNFLHASKPGNFLCGFVLDFFLEYWPEQEFLIDYFLIDYAIQIAYENFSECKKILDSVPIVNHDLYKLENSLNLEYSPELLDEIKNSALFSKLSWRKPGKLKTSAGKETIYAHLLEETVQNGN